MYYIYVIHNKIDLKIYVGQSRRPSYRWSGHKSYARNNPKLKINKAMHEYGIDNFSFQVIEEWETVREVDQAEEFWIEFFKSKNEEFGYNVQSGGASNNTSLKTREKIRKSLLGIKHTPERIAKARLSRRRGLRPWNKETKGLMKSNHGSFKKGIIPWNKGTKNKMKVPKSAWKLGRIPWNKGIHINISKVFIKGHKINLGRKFLNRKSVLGENTSRSKLTNDQVLEMVAFYKTNEFTLLQLAEKFSITRSAVNAILIGRNWSHLTGIQYKPKKSSQVVTEDKNPLTSPQEIQALDILSK